jgi:hypothetical protein
VVVAAGIAGLLAALLVVSLVRSAGPAAVRDPEPAPEQPRAAVPR